VLKVLTSLGFGGVVIYKEGRSLKDYDVPRGKASNDIIDQARSFFRTLFTLIMLRSPK